MDGIEHSIRGLRLTDIVPCLPGVSQADILVHIDKETIKDDQSIAKIM